MVMWQVFLSWILLIGLLIFAGFGIYAMVYANSVVDIWKPNQLIIRPQGTPPGHSFIFTGNVNTSTDPTKDTETLVKQYLTDTDVQIGTFVVGGLVSNGSNGNPALRFYGKTTSGIYTFDIPGVVYNK